jgi:hypothetical protein
MQNQIHFLDQLALNWKSEEEQFFLDCEFSEDYVELKITKTDSHTWSIENHELEKSQNLVEIFEKKYKNNLYVGFVPLFDMVAEMFTEKAFAPSELDLGEIVVFDEIELSDVLSGIEGNFGNNGWVLSKRLIELLKQYKIGNYQTYPLRVRHRGELLLTYVYLHFHSYADQYINYSKSKFYIQKGGNLQPEDRSIITVNDFEEIKRGEDNHNSKLDKLDWKNLISIRPKELFLNPNEFDLFRFDEISSTDMFMSVRLAAKLNEEKIKGFDFKKTTKVKTF